MDVDIAPFDLGARLWDTASLAQEAMASANQPGWALAAQYLGEVTTLPGLLALGGFRDEQLVGMLVGWPTASRDWWPNQVRPALEAEGNERWLMGAFELAELHVHPDVQGLGIGSKLLSHAQQDIEQPRIVLSTNAVGNQHTHEFYRLQGFGRLAGPFSWPATGHQVFVLGKTVTVGNG